MPRERKAAKKSYASPSFKVLDAAAAKAELKAKGVPEDASVHKMLSLIEGQLKKKKKPRRLDKSA